jgi:hypothetical protein
VRGCWCIWSTPCCGRRNSDDGERVAANSRCLLLVVFLITKPLGDFHRTRLQLVSARGWIQCFVQSSASSTVSQRLMRPMRWIGKSMRWRCLLFSGVSMILLYVLTARAAVGVVAVEPAESCRGGAGAGVQHRRFLYHKHQLAKLRTRNHRELPHADGRHWPITTGFLPRQAWLWRSPSFAASRGASKRPSEISGWI